MANNPFTWGANGQKATPSSVKKYADIAAALAARGGAPQNLGEGLNRVGEALLSNAYNARAAEGEAEGAAARKAVMDALLGNPDAQITDFAGALADPWVSSDPGSAAVVSALMDRSNRNEEWGREDAQLQQQRQWQLDDAANQQPDYPSSYDEFQLTQANPEYGSFLEANKPGTNVTVNNGGASGKFYDALDTDLGEQQAALIDSGRNAQSNNIRLGQLEQLLTSAPQGAAGAFTQFAGGLGIPLEGLNEVQAAQAIINQMVPGQRPPGSGTMSDADLALFKQSLPAIINQPGGNTAIIQTTKAINEYTIKQAEIAARVASREITPEQGRAEQASIPNPLEGFSGGNKAPGARLRFNPATGELE